MAPAPPPVVASTGADPRVLDAPPGRGLTAARLLRAMAFGVVGVLLGSRGLAAWASALPEGWERLQAAVGAFDGAMARVGLTVPYDVLHAWFRALIAAGGSS